MARPCKRTISINTLNLLADEIEKAVSALEKENGQGNWNTQAVCRLNKVCDYLRTNESSSDSSMERKSIASCGNS